MGRATTIPRKVTIATLSVWKFPRALDADRAELTLKRLVEQDAIVIHDAAFVVWPDGARKPRTHPFRHDKAKQGVAGSLWGLLFGALFGLPVAGVAVGAVAGLVKAKLGQLALDDDVVERLRGQITEGTAAMFVLSSGAVRPTVRRAFQGQEVELLYSNLTGAEEDELRRGFEQRP